MLIKIKIWKNYYYSLQVSRRKDTRSWTLKGNHLRIPQTKKNRYYVVDQFEFYFQKGKLIGARVTWDKNLEEIAFELSKP